MRTPLMFAVGLCIAALLWLALAWQDGALQLARVSPSPDRAAARAAPPLAQARQTAGARSDAATAPSTSMAPPAAVVPAGTQAGADRPAPGGDLLLPVAGIRPSQLQDTFTDARSAGRSHDAIDIMAPAGTPVLAVADGHVEKLFDSARGGLTIYQFEPGGELAYYYAHLQRYADGLAEGQAVKRGQVIGYVGSTGNASPDAPHLHFAIFVLGPEKRWWEGIAINPYPLLGGTARREAASRP